MEKSNLSNKKIIIKYNYLNYLKKEIIFKEKKKKKKSTTGIAPVPQG
jgi:hypothetical protein